MGILYLNDKLAIITKNQNGSKSSAAVYICAHGGSTSGKTFMCSKDVVFYCPDGHELNTSANVFFSNSIRRIGAQPFTYASGPPVPDYYLTKAMGQSKTTGF